jgi:hypothetical protein
MTFEEVVHTQRYFIHPPSSTKAGARSSRGRCSDRGLSLAGHVTTNNATDETEDYTEDKIPIVDCRPVKRPYGGPTRQWEWFCEHCWAWHRHSASPGRRAPHCTKPDSPFANTGYSLRLRPEVYEDLPRPLPRTHKPKFTWLRSRQRGR